MENLANKMNQAVTGTDEKEGKYLTFMLDEEEYGIGILKIKEIIGMMPITTVPQTPGFVKGVINLRGKVIPVIDLRLRFGMEAIEYSDRTCIIVIEIEDRLIGLIVDTVEEVLEITENNIEPPPKFKSVSGRNRYVSGIGKVGNAVKILLNVDSIFQDDELSSMDDLSGSTDEDTNYDEKENKEE